MSANDNESRPLGKVAFVSQLHALGYMGLDPTADNISLLMGAVVAVATRLSVASEQLTSLAERVKQLETRQPVSINRG